MSTVHIVHRCETIFVLYV